MVSKSGFIPNSRRHNPTRAGKIFKQDAPLNAPNGLNVMFNASQIPDNPGYMDFNNPTPPISAPNPGSNKKIIHNTGRLLRSSGPPRPPVEPPHRNNWMPTHHPRGAPPMRPVEPKFINRQYNGMDMPRRNMPPVPPMPIRGPMPPPIPMEPMPNHFTGPPGPMMRNNIVGTRPGRPLPPIPPTMMRRNRNIPPMRRPNIAPTVAPVRIIKHKRNGRPIKTTNINKSDSNPSKKTLKEIINQYPLDKPWVTDEIRQEHDKKEDIVSRLQGNKNDELFAEFKVQRDKFVHLYESARDKYLEESKSKDNENNMTEPDKKTAENKSKQI